MLNTTLIFDDLHPSGFHDTSIAVSITIADRELADFSLEEVDKTVREVVEHYTSDLEFHVGTSLESILMESQVQLTRQYKESLGDDCPLVFTVAFSGKTYTNIIVESTYTPDMFEEEYE